MGSRAALEGWRHGGWQRVGAAGSTGVGAARFRGYRPMPPYGRLAHSWAVDHRPSVQTHFLPLEIMKFSLLISFNFLAKYLIL